MSPQPMPHFGVTHGEWVTGLLPNACAQNGLEFENSKNGPKLVTSPPPPLLPHALLRP